MAPEDSYLSSARTTLRDPYPDESCGVGQVRDLSVIYGRLQSVREYLSKITKRLLTTRRTLQSETIDSLRREVLRQSIRLVNAEEWAAEAESCRNHWHQRAEKAEAELDAIKRARSAAVAKGNTTRRLKREAEKVSA